MDYVISIENCSYMRWQVALFEESLRMHGLDDNLVVTCANYLGSPLKQKRVVYHENVGREVGYLCLNRAKGLQEAVQQGKLSQPFVSVDPDSFMVRPVPPTAAQVSAHKIFYASAEMLLKRDGYDVYKMFGVKKWPGVGCCYQFSNVPEELFDSIYEWTLKLAYMFLDKKETKGYWQSDITAYNIAMQDVDLEVVDFYETPLDVRQTPRHDDPCFVHYCNGCPPYFNKRMHNSYNWFSMSSPLPFQAILEIPTQSMPVLKFQEVVRSYLARKPDVSEFLSK